MHRKETLTIVGLCSPKNTEGLTFKAADVIMGNGWQGADPKSAVLLVTHIRRWAVYILPFLRICSVQVKGQNQLGTVPQAAMQLLKQLQPDVYEGTERVMTPESKCDFIISRHLTDRGLEDTSLPWSHPLRISKSRHLDQVFFIKERSSPAGVHLFTLFHVKTCII